MFFNANSSCHGAVERKISLTGENYYAPSEALSDLGERTLAGRVEKILGE